MCEGVKRRRAGSATRPSLNESREGRVRRVVASVGDHGNTWEGVCEGRVLGGDTRRALRGRGMTRSDIFNFPPAYLTL